ncbi:MAG: ATP-binding cassette domain-containing protein [Candidatus Babeliaceae bacterium]
MIILQNVSFSRGKNHLLTSISLQIPQGKIISFLGKSGIGKTTLLRCIAQLESHYTGLIKINGHDIRKIDPLQRAHLVGFVFQHYYLFPHLTVLENCMQPLMVVTSWNKEKAEQQAYNFLKKLSVDDLAEKYPHQLSGGQQQRVALTRALGLQPKVLLLDEPTAALDAENIAIIEKLLKTMKEDGMTLIIASHNETFVKAVSDDIYTLQAGKLI